jgi:hypothetical protein
MITFAPIAVAVSHPGSTMHTASEIGMEKYCGRARKLSVKSSTDLAERIVAFLRRRSPFKTGEAVAADTGIAASTIGKWLEGTTVPGGVAFVRLVAAYGPEFLYATMASPPAWLDAAARAERQARLQSEIAALQRRLEAT